MSFEIQRLVSTGSIAHGPEKVATVRVWRPYPSPFGGSLRMQQLDKALLIAAERAKGEGDDGMTRVVRELDSRVLAVFVPSATRLWM